MKKCVAIDLVPIRVGEGGAGSGIWTYARELLHAMDEQDFQGLEVVALVNDGQLPYLSSLRNIRLVRIPTFGKNIALRLLWVHVALSLVCLFRRFEVLHKLATETPLFCSARRVTTIHDFYYEFLMANHPSERIRLYKRLENLYFSLTTRTCFGKSRAIISVSEATKQEAVRRYPDSADRIHVIHHGVRALESVDVGEYGSRGVGGVGGVSVSPIYHHSHTALSLASSTPLPLHSTTENLNGGAFKILCVAKFMEHKGQHLLIDAFEVLLEQNPDFVDWVCLDLRGFHNDGDYYRMICQKVAESRFLENIHLVPYCANEGLNEIYKGVNLVVLLSSYEGFGLPVLEAQGKGIPVLCSDLPVLQEVGGEGAVYVERENIGGVAQAICRFIDDVDYYRDMKERALKNVGRFSWGKAAEQTLEIYRKVSFKLCDRKDAKAS